MSCRLYEARITYARSSGAVEHVAGRGDSAAHRRLERCGVIALRVVAREVEVRQRCARGGALDAYAAFEGRALLRNHAVPRERRQRSELGIELLQHCASELVLRQVLMRPFCADDRAEQAPLAADRF